MLVLSAATALFGTVGIWSLDLVVPRYAAAADVAIIQRTGTVAIDERFTAVERERERGERLGRQGRRSAMVGLAHQADLAERVFERLQEQLDEEESPAGLLSAIEVELVTVGMANRPNSDLIRLTAFASGPALAKALADAWAEEFVADVNVLYEDVPARVVDTVAAELASVRTRYEDAETRLRTFMATSRLHLIEQQIAAKDAVIEEVVTMWRLTATAAFQKDITSRLAALDEDLEQLRKAQSNLQDAQGLRMLLEGNSPSSVASNSLAIHLFKARLVTVNPNLEIRLGELPTATAADQRQDLDATIASLREHVVGLEAKVTRQTRALSTLVGEDADDENGVRGLLSEMVRQLDTGRDQPMMTLLTKLEGERRALAKEHQNELKIQADLTVERDLMRTTLSTLQNEVVELELTVASAPSWVRLASHAVLPVDTAWPAAPLVGGISLVLGFLAALLLVPVASAMGWRPPLGGRFAPA